MCSEILTELFDLQRAYTQKLSTHGYDGINAVRRFFFEHVSAQIDKGKLLDTDIIARGTNFNYRCIIYEP